MSCATQPARPCPPLRGAERFRSERLRRVVADQDGGCADHGPYSVQGLDRAGEKGVRYPPSGWGSHPWPQARHAGLRLYLRQLTLRSRHLVGRPSPPTKCLPPGRCGHSDCLAAIVCPPLRGWGTAGWRSAEGGCGGCLSRNGGVVGVLGYPRGGCRPGAAKHLRLWRMLSLTHAACVGGVRLQGADPAAPRPSGSARWSPSGVGLGGAPGQALPCGTAGPCASRCVGGACGGAAPLCSASVRSDRDLCHTTYTHGPVGRLSPPLPSNHDLQKLPPPRFRSLTWHPWSRLAT
jgi:hypothetical protein